MRNYFNLFSGGKQFTIYYFYSIVLKKPFIKEPLAYDRIHYPVSMSVDSSGLPV